MPILVLALYIEVLIIVLSHLRVRYVAVIIADRLMDRYEYEYEYYAMMDGWMDGCVRVYSFVRSFVPIIPYKK